MAQSNSHKFGQIIGDILENSMYKHLSIISEKFNLFLDKKGERKARRGKKVSWIDSYENSHDLDFVLERNGTEEIIGEPVAFIESAWRRYTKHSRNKAQEIQGAILPLATKHSNNLPFLGVILAGEFTSGALNQLRSRNFNVLYFPYTTVVEAFKINGIDAKFNEDTTEEEFALKISQFEKCENKDQIIDDLILLNRESYDSFISNLEKTITRYIENIIINPLYGSKKVFNNFEAALIFIKDYDVEMETELKFEKFEIRIIYNNGDNITAIFSNVSEAYHFIDSYRHGFRISE
ncbi:DNA methylase [Elizabethkingia anophelis]|nr:DNA methylase [Elizabethkingia anophelis]